MAGSGIDRKITSTPATAPFTSAALVPISSAKRRNVLRPSGVGNERLVTCSLEFAGDRATDVSNSNDAYFHLVYPFAK